MCCLVCSEKQQTDQLKLHAFNKAKRKQYDAEKEHLKVLHCWLGTGCVACPPPTLSFVFCFLWCCLQHALSRSGLSTSLLHSSLVSQARSLDSLQSRLGTARQTLSAYHDLPPDVSLARVRVAEAQQKLQQLREQFQHALDAQFTM
jgi:hypothetical protein